MSRSKAPAKKQQKKGIDFKKIKRKLGRKLPPPNNATNTEIKSKAIILHEQSVAAERDGFATSKKGLTLLELKNRTGHPNAKVRKDALHGIKDLLKHHPAELQSNKYATTHKLRELITDDDKLVRDDFYTLLTGIFLACKEDINKGLMVSSLMPYIFTAMTKSSIEVRLMAFKFFRLVLEFYSPTFSLYAEKILENYKDVIHNNHFYIQDKKKLKVVLLGLADCLSLLPCDQSDNESKKKGLLQYETLLACEQDAAKECVRFAHVSGILKEIVAVLINCFQDFLPLIHASQRINKESFDCIRHILRSIEIFLEVSEWSHLPCDLSNRFLEFIENALLGKITRSNSLDKTLLALLPFVPKLLLRVDRDRRDNLMQAFTITFNNCKPESSLKLACISVVKDLIIPNGDILYPNDPTVNNYQRAWVNKLPSLLNQLGDKHHVSTKVVLQLLLDLALVGCLNASPTFEEEIRSFFIPFHGEGEVPGGPFVSLPREVQEVALCFLYYFIIDNFSSPMLKAIVSCCLYEQLEPAVLYRIVEILQTAYRAGYIQITDHFSFFITLISRFKVVPEKLNSSIECDERKANCGTFKTLTNLVCSYLSEMGDSSLVLHILEKVFVEQIILKPALDNGCAILRMICALDSKPTRLSEISVTTLSEFLPGYLIDIVNCIPEDKERSYLYMQTCLYYLLPCYFLFDRSSKLTEQVLKRMRSMVSENVKALESVQDRESGRDSLNLIQCIVSVILLMHNDVKVRKIISSSKSEIDLILQNVYTLQSSRSTSLTVEGKHMMKIAAERLSIASNSLLA
ncbi:hypothetical protein AXX17_AT5G26970 [Arabidopsis thaliana]|uniref:TEX10-like TPR repeats domain-containing protein n=1 Tax=Arabidopsis thaliana TaxID=3702 RepID=A0A178UGV4_ARATH|nr:hypothetical protein AXX17_AT5G26970 [Arabidopsis thaliana]